jgi:hypothetical protein
MPKYMARSTNIKKGTRPLTLCDGNNVYTSENLLYLPIFVGTAEDCWIAQTCRVESIIYWLNLCVVSGGSYWTEYTKLLILPRHLLCVHDVYVIYEYERALPELVHITIYKSVGDVSALLDRGDHTVPRQHLVAGNMDGEFDWLLLRMADGGERLINWWTWLIVLRRGLSSGPDWPVTPDQSALLPPTPHLTLSHDEFSRVATEFSSAVGLQCAVLACISSWQLAFANCDSAVTFRFGDSQRRHESTAANCHDHETWAFRYYH